MDSILESKTKDQLYIIYSAISGFLLIGFYYFLCNFVHLNPDTSIFITFLIFSIFFDIRHLFPTYSRTFFDKQYMAEHRKWYYFSWFLVLFIPVCSFIYLSSGQFSSYNSFIVFSFLLRLTYLLGFYHLIKQNWGFMAIYKKKFNEPEDGSDRWEKLMLLSGSFISFTYLSWKNPVWFKWIDPYAFSPDDKAYLYTVEIWHKIAATSFVFALFFLFIGFVAKVIPAYRFVSRNLGFLFLFVFILIKWILSVGKDLPLQTLLSLLIFIFIISSFFVFRRTFQKKIFNKEKFMVLFASLILYNGVALIPLDNIHLFAMAVTLPHDIQYLEFVHFFNRKYYANSTKNHGFAKKLAMKTPLFIFITFVYAFIFEGLRTGVAYVPIYTDSFNYFRNLIAVFFLGMVHHHYYLDAVIWRVRKDQQISSNL